MSGLFSLYKQLEKYKDFDIDDNAIKFLDIADEIILKNNPQCFPALLSYFNDRSEYTWVLESLKGALENFDNEIYVKSILENLHLLIPTAIEWACNILYSIFNDESCMKTFEQNMHLAKKEDLIKLFDLMEKESPHHKALIERLRKKL